MRNILYVFRERHYYHHRSCVWFERCPVIKQTGSYVTVKSESFKTLQYPGGEFRLSIAKLQQDGFHHHHRHGERFWLHQPRQGDLFPSEQLLLMRSAVYYEALGMNWDMSKPLHQLEEWQGVCYILAKFLEKPLREVVDRWKLGGESAVKAMWKEVQHKRDEAIRRLSRDE